MSIKQMTFKKGMTFRDLLRELKWVFKDKPPPQTVRINPVKEGETGSMANG